MIEVKNLYKTIKSTVILDHVSLQLSPGKISCIIGPNGAGKSSLMKAITGYLTLNSGHVLVNHQDLTLKQDQLTKYISFIPDARVLQREMRVEEHFDLFARLHHRTQNEEDTICNLLGLEKHLHKKVYQLSYGLRQALLIACTLLHAGDTYFLDEPMNGLDPVRKRNVKNYLKELSKTTGVFVSTHGLNDLKDLDAELLFIKNGKLIEIESFEEKYQLIGVTDEIIREYPFVVKEQERFICYEKDLEKLLHAKQTFVLEKIDNSLEDLYIKYYGDES